MAIRNFTYLEDWFCGGPDWFNQFTPGGDGTDWLPALARYATAHRPIKSSDSLRFQRGLTPAPCFVGCEQDVYSVSGPLHTFGCHLIGLSSSSELKFAGDGITSHYPNTASGPGSSARLDGIWLPWRGYGNGNLKLERLRIEGSNTAGSIGILSRRGFRVYPGCTVDNFGWHGIVISADVNRGNRTEHGDVLAGATQVRVGDGSTSVGGRYDFGDSLDHEVIAKVGDLVTVDRPFDVDVPNNSHIWPRHYDQRFAGISNSNKCSIRESVVQSCGHNPGTDPLLVTPANPTGRRRYGCGLYVTGGDANIVSVTDCSFNDCPGWGVDDDAFLGPNEYVSCHVADGSHTVEQWELDLLAHPEATAQEILDFDVAEYTLGQTARLAYRAQGGNLRSMLVQPYIEGGGRTLWTPLEGWVVGGINVDIGSSSTKRQSVGSGSRGAWKYVIPSDKGGSIELEINPFARGDCWRSLKAPDDNSWPLRDKYGRWPSNNPNGSRSGADSDAGFWFVDWANKTTGMRTTGTYARAVDGRMYTRTVPTTSVSVAGGVATAHVAEHPFAVGDWIWSENHSFNVASTAPVQVSATTPTSVSYSLATSDGDLTDGVGNLKAHSSLKPGMPVLPDVIYRRGRHCIPEEWGALASLPDLSNRVVACRYPVGSRYVVSDPSAGGPSEYRCVADGGAPHGLAWKALVLEA